MDKSKKLTDGALLTAVYIVLLIITIFVPFIIIVGLFVLPIPFIIYAARYNWQPALLMLLAAIFLSFIIATVISLPITLLVGIGGIFIGTAIHNNLKAYETWARGALGFITGMVFILLMLQFVFDINIYEQMDIMIEDSLAMTRTLMEQMGVSQEIDEQIELFEAQFYTFTDLLPSSIAITSILIAFVSLWLSYKLINRIENKHFAFPPFREFNLPISVIWIYFFALIFSFFDLSQDSGLYVVVLNVIALTTVLISIQGYSFVFFYADHKKMHISIPIVVSVITLLLPFLFMFVIRILGIIDLGFSLKARLKNSNT